MIELKSLKKTYRAGSTGVRALDDVSLKIAAGEFVAIMGPSGSGKSTLLHTLGALDRPDSGSYRFAGISLAELRDDELSYFRNRFIGFVFQQFHLLPRLSALKNVELPMVYAGKRHLAEDALSRIEEVGLAHRASHRPNEMSGGEQQRVAIARSLVNGPYVILADEPTGNLDTKSADEIISILEGLHRSGKTIIMVTHEKEIALHAGRVINMLDGRIVSDELRGHPGPGPVADTETFSPQDILSGLRESGHGAGLLDHLRQAARALAVHKMRSFLSMLGILVGVAAVIAMIAVGQGAKQSISESLASLGSNLLTIRPGSPRMHGIALGSGEATRFVLKDAEAISALPHIRRVSASVRGRAQAVYGNKNWNTQVIGAGEDYGAMRASEPQTGRFFTKEEVRIRSKVVLVGATVLENLFGDINPLGSTIKINRISFRVIGVLPRKGATMWRDEDDLVIMPVTTAMYRVLGKQYVDSIDAEVRDASIMEEAQEAIRELVIKQHRLNGDKGDTFEIRNLAEIQDVLASTTRTMTALLGCIAAISLVVGGIGIMNIMLVSVAERTREIGLRHALGARKKDIMMQFLIESVVMTFAGGVAGIVFGCAAATVMAIVAGWATKISALPIIVGTAFSIAVGLIFGLWPARQAARLNPVEALRYE